MTRGVVCESAGVYDNNGTVLGILASGAAAGGDLGGTYPNPTLAAIGAATGPIGDTTHTPVVTIDTKGRVTALTSAAIAFPADAVTSVFTRTGAVVATTGDYTAAQVGALAATAAAGGDLAGNFPSPTLAAIGSATGPIGDATTVPVVTIDTKGRVTALTSAAISAAAISNTVSADTTRAADTTTIVTQQLAINNGITLTVADTGWQEIT